jgi:phosphinothricin acetyltransferase
MISTNIRFEPLSERHRTPVIDIYNYYIEHSFASFLEIPASYEFYDVFLAMMKGLPAIAIINDEKVAGFCFLRPYSPIPAFHAAAEISYFLRPEMTRKGLGHHALAHLIAAAKQRGISHFIACVSSLNEQGIRFHYKNGFSEQGRLAGIGKKFNSSFDVIWFQKKIE